jgi:HD-like signal output (HDOD) protein
LDQAARHVPEDKTIMERILFVDGNKDVLEGFKRVLFKMRREWHMEFAASGEDALERVERGHFTAIVSDTGMPGISGIQLMQIIRENHPGIARIIVSANADMRELLDALGTAHQFLVKPVDPEILKDTLLRVMSLMNELRDPGLKSLLHKLHSLPTQPELHLELLQAIAAGSIREIGHIIEKDPAIAVKVLQLVNSPYLGVHQRITEIHHAVSLLGIDILKALVLSLEIFSKFPLSGASRRELDSIFAHCTDVANYSRVIAHEISGRRDVANDAYMGGMVHDVGKLIFLSNFNDRYLQVKEEAARTQRDIHDLERETFGVDHARLGAYLLGLWGLPEILVETVAYHHIPAAYYYKKFSPVLAVHIGNALKHQEETGLMVDTKSLPADVDLTLLRELNLIEKVLPAVRSVYTIKNRDGLSNGPADPGPEPGRSNGQTDKGNSLN